MASIATNQFKTYLMDGITILSAGNYKCALVTSAIITCANLDDYTTYNQVSATEVTGTGYTVGGQLLSGLSVTQNDTTNQAIWSAGDTIWTNSTIPNVRGAIIYTSGTNKFLSFTDFGSLNSSQNSNFQISWTGGICNLN